MANSGLRGSFPLTEEGISSNVGSVSPGAYALGSRKGSTFHISYVGRADSDVARRLRDHIGNYERFKYEYYGSPKAAFEKECHLYHDINPPENAIHPDRPDGSNWTCPVCANFN